MNLMQTAGILLGSMCSLAACSSGPTPIVPIQKIVSTKQTRPGWKLGVQAWSFNRFSFYQAAEKAASVNLAFIEAYPGQKLTPKGKAAFHHNMSKETRKQVLSRLQDLGVKVINYGVVGIPKTESGCRKLFNFARAMGIETIVAEPAADQFDLLEKLCVEYNIGLAIHNHPSPSLYWHPDKVAKVLHGRSSLLGACADTGHWMRSGLDPLGCMRILEGRIRSFHFKDRSSFGPESKQVHDVPWGSGKGSSAKLLAAARKMGFTGTFMIEYEYNWNKSLPEIAACVKFFRQQAPANLAPTFQPLLPNGLKDALLKPGAWAIEEGILTRKGGGFLWTAKRYRNFILTGSFKLAKKTNSGVFFRTASLKNWLHTGIEMQVLDSFGKEKPSKHDCGAIYDIKEPKANLVKPPGKWYHFRITAIGPILRVELNGGEAVRIDLDQWTTAHRNPDGTRNKFNRAYAKLNREGHIGFQDHGNPIWYKNLQIKDLSQLGGPTGKTPK